MRNAKARSQPSAAAEIQKPDEQWRRELTPEQYAVLRRGHTEMAFTGKYVRNSRDGGSPIPADVCGSAICSAGIHWRAPINACPVPSRT